MYLNLFWYIFFLSSPISCYFLGQNSQPTSHSCTFSLKLSPSLGNGNSFQEVPLFTHLAFGWMDTIFSPLRLDWCNQDPIRCKPVYFTFMVKMKLLLCAHELELQMPSKIKKDCLTKKLLIVYTDSLHPPFIAGIS